ncbi:MAG: pilus assembly protein N-terminal domain-containing protein [Planctomycetaceae bacterium]
MGCWSLVIGLLLLTVPLHAQTRPSARAPTIRNNDVRGRQTSGRMGRPAADVVQAGGADTVGSPPRPIIQQVQNTPESARAVHHLIESMPTRHETLQLIERRSQLIVGKVNIVRLAIADETIVDVAQYSPREISLIGCERGSTTLTVWFEGQTDPLIFLVQVVRDPDSEIQRRLDYGDLERKINSLFPNSKIYLIPLSQQVIVRGQARDPEEAARILDVIHGEVVNQERGSLDFASDDGFVSGFLVNELKVPGEFQVNVRCVIAELNRTQARKQGIDLSNLFHCGNWRHAENDGAPGARSGVFNNGDINRVVNWLAANGTAKILTEPNTTVLSGRPAEFLAGGEFAVPTVVGINGAAGQTTTFRGFGTSMLVTPTVTDHDLIRLTAIAEFSALNSRHSVNNIPGLDTRRVQTTVELREGQTLALGGLLSQTMVTEVVRMPYLGAIPKLGPKFFSHKRSSLDETELLILVTPEIVRPMDACEVPPVPGFDVTYPSDHEFWKRNQIEGLPDPSHSPLPPYGSVMMGPLIVPDADHSGFSAPTPTMIQPAPVETLEISPPPPAAPLPDQEARGQPAAKRFARPGTSRRYAPPQEILQAGWSMPQPAADSAPAAVLIHPAASRTGKSRSTQPDSSRSSP